MGSQCCGPELNSYETKIDKVGAVETLREERKGLPSEKIAVRLADIPIKYKSDAELQNINRMVFKVAEYERKFKEPFRINRPVQLSNRLQQPYYIPSLQIFYVGQWIFNEALNQNVPGGIGRLYEDGVISEGVFKTKQFTNLIEPDEQNNSFQSLNNKVQNDEQKAGTTNQVSKIKKLLKSDRKQMANDYNFVVMLNGTGRVNSFEEDTQDQIILEGQFSQGKLNGKGTLKTTTNEEDQQFKNSVQKKKKKKKTAHSSLLAQIPESDSKKNTSTPDKVKNEKIIKKTDYFYNGFWKEGEKHGKGTEKIEYFYKQKTNQLEVEVNPNVEKNQRKTIFSQSFKYEGLFFENAKHGKGSLTFLGTPKVEHEILRDIQKMELQMANEGESIKADVTSKLKSRQQKQKHIQQALDKLSEQKFKAHHIKLKMQRSLLFDINFNIERAHRTIFSENYVGDFVDGQMSGQGTYVWPNGKTYRGKWKQNKLDGKGQFYWPDQTYYQGDYLDDERTGEGIMIWSLFKRYRGNWAYGMRHGYGQSIQIKSNSEEMVIKGSIWDRDKVKRKLFEETISIKGLNTLQNKQSQVQESLTKNQISDEKLDKQPAKFSS